MQLRKVSHGVECPPQRLVWRSTGQQHSEAEPQRADWIKMALNSSVDEIHEGVLFWDIIDGAYFEKASHGDMTLKAVSCP